MSKLAIVLGVTTTLTVVGVVAGVVPVTINNISATHHGYDLEHLKNKVNNEDTFLVMFGRKDCTHCRNFYNALQDPNHELSKKIKEVEDKQNIDHLVHYYYNKYAWLRGGGVQYAEFNPMLSSYIDNTYTSSQEWKDYGTSSSTNLSSTTSNTTKSISTPFVMIFKKGELQWLGNAGSSSDKYQDLQTQVKSLND